MTVLTAYSEDLQKGTVALGLSLSSETVIRLLAYGDLLLKWNRVYNLTALTDPPQIVACHLLDALAVLPFLKQVSRIADIGSGAGLPGIPLNIARPDLCVHSIEAVNKKASFQRQVKIELVLPSFFPEHLRVQDFHPEEPFDGIISRAFSSLKDFVLSSGHLLAPGGRLFAMKGGMPEREISELPRDWKLEAVHKLSVPGLNAERHLLEIGRA